MKKQFKESNWIELLKEPSFLDYKSKYKEGFYKGSSDFKNDIKKYKTAKEINAHFDLVSWVKERIDDCELKSQGTFNSVGESLNGKEHLFFEGGFCSGYIYEAKKILKVYPLKDKNTHAKLSDIFYFATKYSEVVDKLVFHGFCVYKGEKLIWKPKGSNAVQKLVALYLVLINKGYLDLSKIVNNKEIAFLFSTAFNAKFDLSCFNPEEININQKLIELYKFDFHFL